MKILIVVAALFVVGCGRPVGTEPTCAQAGPYLSQPNRAECTALNYVTYQRWFECQCDLDAFLGTRRVISVDDSEGFEVLYCSKDGMP